MGWKLPKSVVIMTGPAEPIVCSRSKPFSLSSKIIKILEGVGSGPDRKGHFPTLECWL